jgi:lysophospholipase L1-like esterase
MAIVSGRSLKGFQKFARGIRDAWLIFGIALLMFAIIEAVFSLALAARSLWHPPSANFRSEADTYADHAWSAQYYKELDAFERTHTMRWRPYVYWRRPPYHGSYINITSDGLRHTTHVPVLAGATRPTKVFMFGGSTMWGLGADDSSTIPSLVAKEINKSGEPYDVVNFGQYAYVSTQGVIELLLQLQRGNIPDVVIFYDGVNDTFGAFQLGVPGFPYEEFTREKAFNLPLKTLATVTAQRAVGQLGITRVVNGFLERAGLRRDHVQTVPLEYDKPWRDKEALADAVAETYMNNIKLVQALAESYGFTALFYWQPVIYLKAHLTDYERDSLEREANYPGMKEFYLETYAALKRRAARMTHDTAFHDISAMLHDVRDPIYVDFNHMGERGNRLIANRIAHDLAHKLHTRSFQRRSHELGTGEASGADLFDLSTVERR